MVPSTSSKRAIFLQIKLGKYIHNRTVGNRSHYYNSVRCKKVRARLHSAGEHFNVSVDSGDDLEFALVNFSFVTGDRPILALGKNYAREGAD